MVIVKQWSIVAQLVQWYLVKPAGLSFRVRAPLVAGFAFLAQLFSSREFLSSNFSRTKRSINFKPVSKVLDLTYISEKYRFKENARFILEKAHFCPRFGRCRFDKRREKPGREPYPSRPPPAARVGVHPEEEKFRTNQEVKGGEQVPSLPQDRV